MFDQKDPVSDFVGDPLNDIFWTFDQDGVFVTLDQEYRTGSLNVYFSES
jgi:hypothetical protein